ncbi:MAG: ribonuclease P protein component [Rhodoferax sp.]|nr:ribonuclease P protein component [Rhodoferax sp.]PIW07429.1 MAG: ribonuclease P protein component [Comamonadaceae bacterium CG17_big_fil_post_rev_8_21_14_2_50_60_13]PIY23178.1 MAG: ribonuclease P protein component [Comamonadaceae bacterium CG_4_10_14_3_um_filter_60_75]PJC13518.1 MAG: ribonuclease P protein component [Comamonadaceae bacterium CG_4_9_14_0_8_um_filter_60_18]NCP54712.1 ribonuclease P protein component [Rhodoferax sp.]
MQHLKSRPQFQAVLAGAPVARTSHFALHCLALPPDADGACSPLFAAHGTWLGAMVPKRWARRAVTRNAIKRQVYALGWAFEASLCHGAHVVRLHRAFDRQQFPSATSPALKIAVRAELSQLFGNVGAPC